MRTRRGYYLAECLVAIALMGATFSTVAVATSGMYRCCRRVREESAGELELVRLAAQLRADAHQALSVREEGPADAKAAAAKTLLLTLGDERSVHYTLRAGRVERVLSRGDEPAHRETYRLPGSFTARWQVGDGRPARMVSLMLVPGPVGSNTPSGSQAIRIDAAVGLLGPPPVPHKS